MILKTLNKKINLIENKIKPFSFLNESIITEIKKVSIDKLPYNYDDLELFIDSETMKTHYNKHYKGYVEKLNIELEKVKGKDFMEKFSKEDGVKKTASGLAYKVLKQGTGKSPKETSVVEVHYHGTLTDGTVFDSSVDRNKTISFGLDRVIKGWTEMLQLMKEGDKVKVVIPSELAYGENGAPPKIPGGATLVFEIELIKVAEDTNPKAVQTSVKK